MNTKVSERLQIFVKKQCREYEFPLTSNIRLYEDLGIYGDDAVEFLVAFSKEFKVDVSRFMAADYFKGEGIDIITPIINLFNRHKSQSVKKNLNIRTFGKSYNGRSS